MQRPIAPPARTSSCAGTGPSGRRWAGAAASELAIPDSLALVGVVVHRQHVVLELGTVVPITAVGSTNALVLTVGAL